jgi:hypothetical protein
MLLCTSLICLLYKGTLLYCITYFNIQRIIHNSCVNCIFDVVKNPSILGSFDIELLVVKR